VKVNGEGECGWRSNENHHQKLGLRGDKENWAGKLASSLSNSYLSIYLFIYLDIAAKAT
jgi:hypothetical protein